MDVEPADTGGRRRAKTREPGVARASYTFSYDRPSAEPVNGA